MTLSPATIGALRTLGSLVLFAVVTTILGFFADPANLGWMSPAIAGLVAAVAGAVEAAVAAKSGKSLFGAVSTK